MERHPSWRTTGRATATLGVIAVLRRQRLGLARAGVADETVRMKTTQDPFEAEFGELPGPTHWPSLLPDQARLAWADLRDRVERLVDGFRP